MAPGSFGTQGAAGELLRGQVVAPLAADAESRGWIMFRNQGNALFAAFQQQDVVGGLALAPGDEVEFRRAACGPCAAEVRLVGRAVSCLGVVSCVRTGPASQRKEVGLIERADAPREVMFHASGPLRSLRVGDEVGFTVKGRPGKETAVGVTRVEPGSVRIEDVCVRRVKGRVVSVLRRLPPPHPQTFVAGKIRYVSSNERHTEVEYGPRAQTRPHTLLAGDAVCFSLAVDRRTQRHCAVNVELRAESLRESGERRETGVVLLVKDDYGLVRSAATQRTVFFSTDELLDLDKQVQVNDEVEYTPVWSDSEQDSTCATRVKLLGAPAVPPARLGHVAAFLESLGFIEPLSLDHDVLFSPRQLECGAQLQLGMPVEYVAVSRGSSQNLWAAKAVRLLPPGSLDLPQILEPVRRGTVVRPLRYFDPHQVSYAGIIEEHGNETSKTTQQFKFGIYSLQNVEDVLLPGMSVTFQVNSEGHAANVKPDDGKLCGQVVFARTWYGYLHSELVPGKLVYFLRSEVCKGSDPLPGDTVEFRLTCNPNNGRFAARDICQCTNNHVCSPAANNKDSPEHQDHPDLNSSLQSSEGSFTTEVQHEVHNGNDKSYMLPGCTDITRSEIEAFPENFHPDCDYLNNRIAFMPSKCDGIIVQDNNNSERNFLQCEMTKCDLANGKLSDELFKCSKSNTNIQENSATKQDATSVTDDKTVVSKVHGKRNHDSEVGSCTDEVERKSALKNADINMAHKARGHHKNGSRRTSYKTMVPAHDRMSVKVVAARQPRGPDGSAGFTAERR